MQKGQIVRYNGETEGKVENGSVGFIVKLGVDDAIATPAEREIVAKKGKDLARIIVMDEQGFIQGAGIVRQSELEEVEEEKWKNAMSLYNDRYGQVQNANHEFKKQMVLDIAKEIGVSPELVGLVIDRYDVKLQQTASSISVQGTG